MSFPVNQPAITCYMCSSPKSSVEHVPARGLFPKAKDLPEGVDLRKQLITVPACDVHNSEKSKDDEYLMYALVMGIQNNATAALQVKTKITRALSANPGVARLLIQYQKPVKVEENATGEVHDTLALRVDAHRVHQALDHIGRALHFHHFGAKWPGPIQAIPLFLLALEGEAPETFNSHLDTMGQAVEELLSTLPAYGANQDVFSYKVATPGPQIPVVMLLTFYEGSKVVLLFKNEP
jgi:hypothetical protein